jgi:hypothetical protein
MEIRISMPGSYERIVAGLFKEEDGRLRFGWSGRSMQLSSIGDLEREPIEFGDYLMEGGIRYRIQAIRTDTGVELNVTTLES